VRPLVAMLPAWFRFAQCLRRYRDTREKFPHLANTAKYASSFFVIIFSTVTYVTSSEYEELEIIKCIVWALSWVKHKGVVIRMTLHLMEFRNYTLRQLKI
jgi:hypothetical protein